MITQVTDHDGEGSDLLISQYKGKPNLAAILSSYLAQVQIIEDVLISILAIVGDIDSQVGEQLDLIGRLVGQPRNGQSDATYLLWIRARILISRASGTPDELRELLTLVAGANVHTITEYYPASLVAELAGAYTGDADAVASILGEIVDAGIGAQLLYALTADTEAFTFASADAEEASALQGLGNYAQTTGGKFADVKET